MKSLPCVRSLIPSPFLESFISSAIPALSHSISLSLTTRASNSMQMLNLKTPKIPLNFLLFSSYCLISPLPLLAKPLKKTIYTGSLLLFTGPRLFNSLQVCIHIHCFIEITLVKVTKDQPRVKSQDGTSLFFFLTLNSTADHTSSLAHVPLLATVYHTLLAFLLFPLAFFLRLIGFSLSSYPIHGHFHLRVFLFFIL